LKITPQSELGTWYTLTTELVAKNTPEPRDPYARYKERPPPKEYTNIGELVAHFQSLDSVLATALQALMAQKDYWRMHSLQSFANNQVNTNTTLQNRNNTLYPYPTHNAPHDCPSPRSSWTKRLRSC
jgi:hypothetical protein